MKQAMRMILTALAALPYQVRAEDVGVAAPIQLDCKTAQLLVRDASLAETAPLIEGEMDVVQIVANAIPPILAGCKGKIRILCITETPWTARAGERVHLAGRISAVGGNYVSVDPCAPSKGDTSSQ